jgi:hypothetical protein
MNEELKTYIENRIKEGASIEDISKSLIEEGGWAESDVDHVFSTIGLESSETAQSEASSETPKETVASEVNLDQESKKDGLMWVLIIALVVAVGLGVFAYFTFIESNTTTTPADNEQSNVITTDDTIVSNYGFSITPSQAWLLWEGRSAYEDSVRKLSEAFLSDSKTPPTTEEELTEYVSERDEFSKNNLPALLSKWMPKESSVLVFTNSPVDVKAKDEDSVLSSYKVENDYYLAKAVTSRPYTYVTLEVAEEKYVHRGDAAFELSNRRIDFLGYQGTYHRSQNHSTGPDTMSLIEIPLADDNYLRMSIITKSDREDADIILELEQFVSELKLGE